MVEKILACRVVKNLVPCIYCLSCLLNDCSFKFKLSLEDNWSKKPNEPILVFLLGILFCAVVVVVVVEVVVAVVVMVVVAVVQNFHLPFYPRFFSGVGD